MINNLKKLVSESVEIGYIAQAQEYGPSRTLLNAISIQREELRQLLELDHEKMDEGELRSILGKIEMSNWILNLVVKAKEYILQTERGEVE